MGSRIFVVPVEYSIRLPTGGMHFERVQVGYSAAIDYLPGDDEMWESLVHGAIFETEEQAERLADKVGRALTGMDLKGINITLWSHTGGAWSPVFSSGYRARAYFVPVAK